jgi:NADH-quinone oxidoreductase subunit E
VSGQGLAGMAGEIIARYPQGRSRSAVMPLLRLAQERDGYVTTEAVEEIAEILGLSSAEVLAVASFYTMYHLRPKGRRVISVCHNLACDLAGAEGLIEHLEHSLDVGSEGGTTADGEFTLERAECLAACDSAPVVQVDYDQMHARMTPETMDALVASLRSDAGPPGGEGNP